MAQLQSDISTVLVKFNSREEVARYIKGLTEHYQKEVEKIGDRLGTVLRVAQAQPEVRREEKRVDVKNAKGQAKGWIRMGSILVNTSDPTTANTEVMYQVHEDFKLRLARTVEASKSFELGANAAMPDKGVFILYLKNGVPERIVVDVGDKPRLNFSFDAMYKVV